MKIVVIAPNVSENLSGEAIKAFQYITHMLANGDDVTLLTHARSRGHLDRFPDMLAVRFVEDGFWQKFFWRSRVLRSLVDVPFFLAVRKIIEGVYAEAPETVFHFLGPVSPIIPRFPVRESKSVLGPITGNIYYPPALRSREPFQLSVRRVLHSIAQRGVGMALNDKAGFDRILISGGERTRQSMKWAGASDAQMRDVFDSGVSDKIMTLSKISHTGVNHRFAATGRLVPHKGVDLAIRAVAKTKTPVTLDIFGSGPEETHLQALIDELGVGERVKLRGWLPSHDDLISELRNYRGYVFPSMAEANGIVIQEGLAMGLPVICLNWGGPTLLTTDATAIRIDPGSDDEIVAALADQMDRLAEDPEFAAQLSDNGFEAARKNFSWGAVSEQWRRAFTDL
ncbi:MAG: glycosyltransferase family 4 protein [Alphaproteobacteria bacterium]|nr:glycosyltransferase family 4 protein [Alphaproteobacteria bacterium]